ncbi:MAG TPA: hypothetical protein VHE12_10390, partial [bacterium]|nr:hypothetical protein [bacterium]
MRNFSIHSFKGLTRIPLLVLLGSLGSVGALQAAAINYTSTSYCPSETSFTVTEQTTAYNQQTSNSVSLGNCGVNMNMYD